MNLNHQILSISGEAKKFVPSKNWFLLPAESIHLHIAFSKTTSNFLQTPAGWVVERTPHETSESVDGWRLLPRAPRHKFVWDGLPFRAIKSR